MSFHTMYSRRRGTKGSGGDFTDGDVALVWRMGQVIPGCDPSLWRLDVCGYVINRWEYANTASEFGWEIDHIRPVAAGGSDNLPNLQPLYWESNRQKGDQYPWRCGQ